MVPDHGCTAYCRDGEHCDLVYSGDDPREDLLRYSVARSYEDTYGVRVTRLKAATEAPDLTAFPAEKLRQVAGADQDDARRWLVWWRDEAPPTHGGRRPNTGGRRPGSGKKPRSPLGRTIRRTVTLSPEADHRISAETPDGGSYSTTLDRIVREWAERQP